MRLHVTHTTRYRYREPMRYAVQSLCLTPQTGSAQIVEYWSLGAPARLFELKDGFGNVCHSYSFIGSVLTSFVNAAGVIQTLGVAEFADAPALPHPLFYLRSTPLAEPHARLAAFARPLVGASVSLQTLLALSRAVAGQVRYRSGSTDVKTTALEAFDLGSGVCQDQAHVMVAACRSLGIPARYVSGYFYAANEPELASHAWTDVCLDVAARRWVSIDVTHGCTIDERHVRLATGTDYNACPPIKGIRHGGRGETMTVNIAIKPAD